MVKMSNTENNLTRLMEMCLEELTDEELEGKKKRDDDWQQEQEEDD